MDFSHPLLVRARQFGRRLGVLDPLQRIYSSLRNDGNEESFERALLSRICRGDIVWDVGANVGYYTQKLADIVGASGRVVAFEPSPKTFATLSTAMRHNRNVKVLNLALADFEGQSDFCAKLEGYNANDSLSWSSIGPTFNVVRVAVKTGDRFITENRALAPTSIKIDVEGFETEVLLGLSECLHTDKLKMLFIEIHFGILAARGLLNSPRTIMKMLRDNGFAISWIHSSHICAER